MIFNRGSSILAWHKGDQNFSGEIVKLSSQIDVPSKHFKMLPHMIVHICYPCRYNVIFFEINVIF